jgi:hypothetical protein
MHSRADRQTDERPDDVDEELGPALLASVVIFATPPRIEERN